MITTEFKKVYWKYYLILERDVLGVEPYILFHPDNYNCFSNEFIKLFQAICSEIDVIGKEYCEYIEDAEEYRDIKDYAKCILKHHPEIVELLEGRSNGSKNDMRLVDFYNDMNDEQKINFFKQSFIPKGVSLELENFEEFYEKRKVILAEKLRELLG